MRGPLALFSLLPLCACTPAPSPTAAADAAVSLTDAALPSDAPTAPLVFIRRALATTTRAAPTCPSPDEAPLRSGASPDAFTCTRLGASPAVLAADWPDASALPAPVRYIRAGVAPGGDGSPGRPFATLAEALSAAPAARTLVFSRGDHPVGSAPVLPPALTLIGAGARATTLTLPPDAAGLIVVADSALSLVALTLRHPDAAPAPESVILLDATRAAVTLRDVVLDHGHDALRLSGGTLSATRLTITRAARYGVHLRDAAVATVTDAVVRDGAQQGVRVEASHLQLTRALVADHARHGIVLLGDASPTEGRASCAGSLAPGARDCFDRVVSHRNGVAALYVEGRHTIDVTLASLAATRLAVIPSGTAGDGLVVGAGATVTLDADVTDPARQGTGSLVVGNARAGIVAQGLDATITVRGALIAANAGGGVVLGANASAPLIGECLLVGNAFGGIVVTPGASAGIVQCNGIVDTVTGTLATSNGDVTMADGVHLNGSRGDTQFVENEVSASARFGLLVNAGRGTLFRNRGGDNLYGIGLYGAAQLVGDLESIRGRAATLPASPPFAGNL
jgi:hypothetical protein